MPALGGLLALSVYSLHSAAGHHMCPASVGWSAQCDPGDCDDVMTAGSCLPWQARCPHLPAASLTQPSLTLLKVL